MKENLPLRVLQPMIKGKENAEHYKGSIAFIEMLSGNRLYLQSNGTMFCINKIGKDDKIISENIMKTDNYKDGLTKLEFVSQQQFYTEYM